MDKKIALLKSLNEAYFKIVDTSGDEVYFIGDEAEKKAEYSSEISDEYDEYIEECNDDDDQTRQIQMSLDEWKEENDKSFYNWCVENLQNVDDEVDAETNRQRRETNFFKFEGDRYLVVDQDELKKHYDEACQSAINELYMGEVENGFIKNFLENHEEELLAFYQRDTNAGEVLNTHDGCEDCQTVDGVEYSIFKQ